MTNTDRPSPRLPWDAADPYPFYSRQREAGDVVWDDTAQAWLILGYHAAREALTGAQWTSDPRANPNASAGPLLNSTMIDANMLFTDGPDHDRLRTAVREVFSRSAVTGLHAGIESLCHDTVSAIPAHQTFDAMTHIARPLPAAVIGAWLGLDSDQGAALQEHSSTIISVLGGFATHEQLEHGVAASVALLAAMLPAAADRRTHPRDDLLSFLAADPNLTLDEVVITAILISVAGHETTAHLIGTSLLRLLTPDNNGHHLAEPIDPTDPAVITELLRLDSPVQAIGRTATTDHTLAGIDIRCGQAVLVCVAAANRDPTIYPGPDVFQPGRPGPAPLTFGYGVHYCLGATLARMETTAALHSILQRHPTLEGPPTWRDTPAIRGPVTLPIRFNASSPAS